MRKFLCDDHEGQLRRALDARGLTDMIAADDRESEVRLRGGGFDPLFAALAGLIGNVVFNAGGFGLLVLDGCALCHAIRIHGEDCETAHCILDHLADWPEIAAEEQRQMWVERERKAGRS